MGIEPTSEAWEASILPLYDARSASYANKPARLLQEFFTRHFMCIRLALHPVRAHARITFVILCNNDCL
jgi:hypothetical protein